MAFKLGEVVKIRGLAKEGLIQFFEAKGQKNVVLRIVDVLDLTTDAQDFLIDIIYRLGRSEANVEAARKHDLPGWRKRFLIQHSVVGSSVGEWVVIPIEKTLSEMSFDDLKTFQAIMFGYVQVRSAKGEPSRIDPCEKCGGSGNILGRECPVCDGGGNITTFLDISPDEAALSEGRKA